ncbi:MAG: response regulator transcription factor [Chloroflexi bacterium]|nr:response regulator transcription factor [Chloroflexota bacterium]
MKQIRVLIVDDHAVVRLGIQMMISTEPTIKVVGEAKDGQDAIRQVKHLQPDIVLMDLVMPQGDGTEAIAEIKRDCPNIKIIVLTTFDDKTKINAAMIAGADGYLLKDADGEALLQAIQAVQQGEMPLHPRIAHHLIRGVANPIDANGIDHLTEREKEILQLVAKGLSNKIVAEGLNLSEGTVKIHVSNILAKLRVSSRIEAALWAMQKGLVALEKEA